MKELLQGEDLLQAQQIRWFRYQYPKLNTLLFAIPNGGYRHRTTAVRMKRTGVVAGVYDLFLSVPSGGYNGLYIENKVGYNKLTISQMKFGEAVKKKGYAVAVCKTMDGFIEVVEQYFRGHYVNGYNETTKKD